MQHGKIVRKTCFEFGSIYIFDVFVFVLIVHLHVSVCVYSFVFFFHLVIMRIITRLLEVVG